MFVFCFFFALHVNEAEAIWVSKTTSQAFEASETIFVGNITSFAIIEKIHENHYHNNDGELIDTEKIPYYLEIYNVNILEYVKNAQNNTEIQVTQPTISGVPGRTTPTSSFSIGDRVLFFIPKLDQNNTYLPESFLIPANCNTFSVLHQPDNNYGANFYFTQEGVKKSKNFVADIPITLYTFASSKDFSGQKHFHELNIFKRLSYNDELLVKNEKYTAVAHPCEQIIKGKINFTLEAGDYRLRLDKTTERGESFDSMNLSVRSKINETLGYGFCPENQFAISKPSTNIYSCVYIESYEKLIDRGWEKPDGCNQDKCNFYKLQ